jgi:hypothetical protein
MPRVAICRSLKEIIKSARWIAIIAILITGCVINIPAISSTPTENTYGLSRDAFQTLSSLEQVNDYPFYVMHYFGNYAYPPATIGRAPHPYACSLFVTLGDQDRLLYGRNWDYEISPALLLYTDPPDGYASVSMVDLSITGITPEVFSGLASKPIPERELLLYAPYVPVDGMNEYGLTIAVAGVLESRAGFDPSKATIGALPIVREILDHSQNVGEAIALFQGYNIDFQGGLPLHYLVSDALGEAVVIEFVDSQMISVPNEHDWHLATNFMISTRTESGGYQSDYRYDILQEELAGKNGILTI